MPDQSIPFAKTDGSDWHDSPIRDCRVDCSVCEFCDLCWPEALRPTAAPEPNITRGLSPFVPMLPTLEQIEASRESDTRRYPFLEYFSWRHLPPKLREVSRPFDELARRLINMAPPARTRGLSDGEIQRALEKLLEAKDCAVRAAMG